MAQFESQQPDWQAKQAQRLAAYKEQQRAKRKEQGSSRLPQPTAQPTPDQPVIRDAQTGESLPSRRFGEDAMKAAEGFDFNIRKEPTVATPDRAVITRTAGLPEMEQDREQAMEDIAVKRAMKRPLSEDDLRTEFRAARDDQRQRAEMDQQMFDYQQFMSPEFQGMTAQDISILPPELRAQYAQEAEYAGLQGQQGFQEQMGQQIDDVYGGRIEEAQGAYDERRGELETEKDQLMEDFKSLRDEMDAESVREIKEAGAQGIDEIKQLMARRGALRSSATAEQLQKTSSNTQRRVADIERATGVAMKEYEINLMDRLDNKLQKYEERLEKYKDAKDASKLQQAQNEIEIAQKIFEANPKNPEKVMELADTLTQIKIQQQEQATAEQEALKNAAVEKFNKALELGYVPTGMSEEEQLVLADNLGIAPENFGATVMDLMERARVKEQVENIHYSQDIFGNTTAVIPNFDTGQFDTVVVSQGPFGMNAQTMGGLAGASSMGPGSYNSYGAVSDDALTEIFGIGEEGGWCGYYSSEISDAGPVGDSWKEKYENIDTRVNINDPSTFPTPGDKLLVPGGKITDGIGAEEYGHVATVIDYDSQTGNMKVIESNANGAMPANPGIKTLGTYNVGELDTMYNNVVGGWGIKRGNFRPGIQKKLDAAAPSIQTGGVDFGTAYNEAVARGAKDPMQTAAIWMSTGQIPERTISPEEMRKEQEAMREEEQYQEGQEKKARAQEYMVQKHQTLTNTIDEVINEIGYWNTGFVGAASADIAGTPAYNLARKLDTIRSQLSFGELQAMRDASPTGGALGSISERELTYLGSVLGSVDIGQEQDQLRKTLEDIKRSVSVLGDNVAVEAFPVSEGKGVTLIGSDGNSYYYEDPNDPEIAEGRSAGFFK